MTESPVLREVLLAVACQPDVLCWRQNVGAAKDRATGQVVRFGVPGCADVIACVSGVFVALETKRPRGGKHAENQKRFRDAVVRAGGIYRLVRSEEEALVALAEARSLAASRSRPPVLQP